ncbi:hypothetical protein QAD02_012323 [Eretmocerus hayati]|uniref:Uncharacterized protein n=1 Tax=Eretmocerus hayati TaxID=131215 RepID=A0ACC2NZF0_9HYME|nr:hypothetical protein QAD02_012323 [Eretmocerus hayati]
MSANFHQAVHPVIVIAQCFGLFPVSGIGSSKLSDLKFTWWSFKVLYCCLSISGSLALILFDILFLFNTTAVYNEKKRARKIIIGGPTVRLVFSLTATLGTVLLLKLAQQWPKLMASWEKVEKELNSKVTDHQTKPTNLATRFKLLTLGAMFLALSEHILCALSVYVESHPGMRSKDANNDTLTLYFKGQFPQIFAQVEFAYWKGFLAQLVIFFCTFSWNFVDLFIVISGIALSNLFSKLNNRIKSVEEEFCFTTKTMPDWWWAEARIDYNRVATIIREFDSQLSPIILLSFTTNLFFICIQFLCSFRLTTMEIETMYFIFSVSFIFVRLAMVSLCASSIHEESLTPLSILYSVDSSAYTKEVQRFLFQVTTDRIGLTGMKFFYITRSFILKVVGTVITYELVLIQFNAVQADHHNQNITKEYITAF